MHNPLVTVLMTVYNGESFLSEAIESILGQTYKNYELLIIDDASTDGSKEIILSYNVNRIRYVRNNYNLGQTASLNYGLKISKGKYIARIDQDDLSYKDRLFIQYNYMKQNPNISVVGNWANSINEIGEYDFTIIHPTEPSHIKESITCGCPLSHSSVFFDREMIMKVGGYPIELAYAMDWGLWIKCIQNNYKISNIPESLVSIRTHSNNATSLKELDLIRISEQYQLFNNSNSIIKRKSTRSYANGLKNYLGLKLFYLFIKKMNFKEANKIAKILINENLFDIFTAKFKKVLLLHSASFQRNFKIEPILKKYNRKFN